MVKLRLRGLISKGSLRTRYSFEMTLTDPRHVFNQATMEWERMR